MNKYTHANAVLTAGKTVKVIKIFTCWMHANAVLTV